ncbi:hypothetical protein D3C84_1071780 [compost metagenome]
MHVPIISAILGRRPRKEKPRITANIDSKAMSWPLNTMGSLRQASYQKIFPIIEHNRAINNAQPYRCNALGVSRFEPFNFSSSISQRNGKAITAPRPAPSPAKQAQVPVESHGSQTSAL